MTVKTPAQLKADIIVDFPDNTSGLITPAIMRTFQNDIVDSYSGGNLSSAVVTSTGSTTARTLATRFADVANVKDFGALGNGSTNDTTAIQAAINSGAKILWFPSGTYIVTSLTPVSDQNWIGQGQEITILSWAQTNINPATQSMIVSNGDISDISFCDMGFRGSLLVQTTATVSEDLECFRLEAGSVQRAHWQRCKIYEFGDQNKTGGAAIDIHVQSGSGKIIADIIIEECWFQDIAYIPGIYIQANSSFVTTAKRITIRGNRFVQNVTYGTQNYIYVLGDVSISPVDLDISDNSFEINQTVDSCIEVNFVSNFTICRNRVRVSGSAEATGIIARAGCYGGVIASNILTNIGTGCVTSVAISLLQFSTGQIQQRISICGNVISDWGTGISAPSMLIASGSRAVVAVGNIIEGVNVRLHHAISCGGAQDIIISDNVIRHASYPIILSTDDGGIDRLEFCRNIINDCGVNGDSLIITPAVSQTVTNCIINDNSTTNDVAGATFFSAPAFVAATGNRVERNATALPPVNPSYAAFVAATSKALLTGTLAYTAASVGANSETLVNTVSVTGAAVGDFSDASIDSDSGGCFFRSRVTATGTVTVYVVNPTAAPITPASGTVTVRVT